jgi:alkylation response protein AidB-like acyl-CoA dehydrogenase
VRVTSALERAHTIAEEVLFPGPSMSMLGESFPDSHFDLLAEAPFVTGWGIIDMLLVSARDITGPARPHRQRTCLRRSRRWHHRRATALGRRCGQQHCPAAFRGLFPSIRNRLDTGLSEPATLTRARAAASELAYRCAGALMAATGSSGIFVGGHAQRLVREAAFTLVAAGRSDIKENLLSLFGNARKDSATYA